MFPDTNHFPAAFAQRGIDAAVPGLVAGDLGQPEGGAGLGAGPVLRTTVPETAVHKHRQFEFQKNEVRFARELGATPPTDDSIRSKNLDQSQLGSLVAAASNGRHQGGPL